MSLAKLPYTSGLRQSYQAQFGGLNHTKGATDGEIYDMRNMTSDHYPVLSPREKRFVRKKYEAIYGLYAYGADVYIVGNHGGSLGLFRENFDGSQGLIAQYAFTANEKQMEVLTGKLVIYPDKVYYDFTSGEIVELGAKLTAQVSFESGELNGARVSSNAINIFGISSAIIEKKFKPGDAVTISGATVVPRNNKTAIIREVDGVVLNFSPDAFEMPPAAYYYEITKDLSSSNVGMLDQIPIYGFYHGKELIAFQLEEDALKGGRFYWEVGSDVVLYEAPSSGHYGSGIWMEVLDVGKSDITTELKFSIEPKPSVMEQEVTIERVIPDFDFLLAVNNRLWGAKGDIIWGSKLGDPTNWNYFDGVSVDSYSVNLGSAGDITGIANYNGYPTFFKEQGIYKLYGSYPSAFQIYSTSTTGAKAGCGKSIAKIGEALYYVSRNGVMVYAGGVPRYIGEELGIRINEAVGGTDGRKYYLCADGLLYVYDTYSGLWHIEDEMNALVMSYGDDLVCVDSDGEIRILGYTEKAAEADVKWWVQFADMVVGSPNKKGIEKVLVRADCSGGGYCDVFVAFDNEEYKKVQRIDKNTKASTILPIVLKRGDHFSLKIVGEGAVDIYGLSYNYYHGSEV